MALEELIPGEKSKAILEFIASRAVPVYAASPELRWPVGTGTLFEVNSHLYLVTAGHVVRRNLAQPDRFRLALPVDQACSKLLAPKTLGGCSSQTDAHDVAVFALDDEASEVLRSGWRVVEAASLATPRSAGPFLMFGYLEPSTQQVGHNPPGQFIGVNAMYSPGGVAASSEPLDADHDLLLEYPSEPIDLLTQRSLARKIHKK